MLPCRNGGKMFARFVQIEMDKPSKYTAVCLLQDKNLATPFTNHDSAMTNEKAV
jgi:hypothetical protein